MRSIVWLALLFTLALAGLHGCGDDEGGCPGSIISSCTDPCPENCAARGLQEVCVGAGYEPNRCCYCE